MVDQTEPWAERTVEVPPRPEAFRPGVAQVRSPAGGGTGAFPAAAHEPTGTGWPGPGDPQRRLPVGLRMRQLRRGGRWSVTGALFAFVCWGIWAVSARADLTTPVVTFVLTLLVAAGLFALCRTVGRVVVERHFGRVRRSARGAHLVTGLFLAGVGVGYLRQTEWVVELWNGLIVLW